MQAMTSGILIIHYASATATQQQKTPSPILSPYYFTQHTIIYIAIKVLTLNKVHNANSHIKITDYSLYLCDLELNNKKTEHQNTIPSQPHYF
jgi:hypothetical protein